MIRDDSRIMCACSESAMNGKAIKSVTKIARIFGTNTSVCSCIWVSAWNSETTTPTTSPTTISGEDTTTMVQIASRATSRVSAPVIFFSLALTRLRHSGMVRKDQTSNAQLRIGESRDSGFDASHRPGMTKTSNRHLHDIFVGLDHPV